MERLELVNIVRKKLDEVSAADTPLQEITIADELAIDTIIESFLDECALEILLKAPFHRLEITSAKPTISSDPYDSSVGCIQAPENFLRLVSLRLSDWKRPVVELAVKGDPLSMRQYNKHIRGGTSKPVGVISKNDIGIVIDCYSTKISPPVLAEFLYIKKDAAENIRDMQMIDALTWICAGKVLSVLGNTQLAQNAYDNAQSLMI